MKNLNMNAQQAMNILEIPNDKQIEYQSLIWKFNVVKLFVTKKFWKRRSRWKKFGDFFL